MVSAETSASSSPGLEQKKSSGDAPVAQNRIELGYRPALDAVRFIAALWVMLDHAGAVDGGGGHAVAVFFVLSGYLIGGQLYQEKRRTGTIRLPEFFFKRITRIWPPYYLVLFLYLIIFFLRRQNEVQGFYGRAFSALTYTYNISNDIAGNIHPVWVSFNQIWSLAIEEQFYLTAPILILFLPVRWLMPASLGLFLALMFALPLYAGLMVGVFLATLLERNPVGVPAVWASLALSVGALACYAALFGISYAGFSQASWVTYLIAAGIVILASRISVPARLHASLRYLGLMTYSYYLIHGIPGYFLGPVYRRALGTGEVPIWLAVVFGLMALPLSYLFVRWIELPNLAWRSRALQARSKWIQRAPLIAWGMTTAGAVGLIVIAVSS